MKAFFQTMITPMSCSLAAQRQEILLAADSLAAKVYSTRLIREKFNCSYSLNDEYKTHLAESGLHLSGQGHDGAVRLIELADHPFFLAMLFQPQLSSSPEQPHPAISSFLKQVSRR